MRPTATMSSQPAVIALVENDLPTNRAFARLLRAHGFKVEAFGSAEQLLARPAEPALSCLLLDVDLDGMSGLELQQLLREQLVATPIIFITGRDDLSVRARAFEVGCSQFLSKPVESHVLVEAIRSAISATASAVAAR
jgi:FixJ family two-component response regulator